MKNFACTACGNKVYFENARCLRCTSELGFSSAAMAIVALQPSDVPGSYRVYGADGTQQVRFCANAIHGACNWVTPTDSGSALCIACALNRTIPNLSETGGLTAWQALERAKKRLVYDLLRLGLPLDASQTGHGTLAFDFMRHARTGHLDGVITIDILEADDVERARQRQLFAEPYRSLLGHLRHESGHFYWRLLVEAGGRIDAFRALFGDERSDYAAALQNHHAGGLRGDWPDMFVSSYASAHPWEDWAETWAHYLHIVSVLDTAEAEGMEPRASGLLFGSAWPFRRSDVYQAVDFQSLMERWTPLSIALNSLSRCMGHDDFYPFVIPAQAFAKLNFVHDAVRSGAN